MLNRCYTTTNKDYPSIGGRGIRVCARWHDYVSFLRDMGEKPPRAALRRIDNTKDFTPENTRWQNRVNARTNRTYAIWKGIRSRCGVIGKKNGKLSKKYHRYAHIDMDPLWAESFQAFAEAVGEPPTKEHSIDRIDNERGYWLDNVRWATAKEQANNRCDNVYIEIKGERKTLQEWCDHHDVDRNVVSYRWAALFSPASTKVKSCERVDMGTGVVLGQYDNAKEAAEATGISYAAITKCASGGNRSAGGFFWRYTT